MNLRMNRFPREGLTPEQQKAIAKLEECFPQGGTLDFFGWGNADEMIFCNFIMYYY